MKKNIIIVGYGEIGRAVYELENVHNSAYYLDIKENNITEKLNFDVMHICYPYSENFITTALEYIDTFNPETVIINSTIIPGTTRKIYNKTKINIAHSPVIGVHPNLATSLRTFTKFVGPITVENGNKIASHFKSIGIKTHICNSPEETEIAKILSTTYYGLAIAWHQEMRRICNKFGANFDVIKEWNTNYNQGYGLLGKPEVMRPVLYVDEKGIGGHCVMPNITLLKQIHSSSFLEAIIESNDIQKNECLTTLEVTEKSNGEKATQEV